MMKQQQQRWNYLTLLEEQARTMLKWEPIKIASASQQELEAAIAEFRRSKEEETKHDDIVEEEKEENQYVPPPMIDLSSHCVGQTQNAQESLMKQLIVCYCAASLQPVTVATIEKVLFGEQNK